MSKQYSTIGVCPFCAAEIPAGYTLIEYERDGQQAAYAECPSCGDVVHPE